MTQRERDGDTYQKALAYCAKNAGEGLFAGRCADLYRRHEDYFPREELNTDKKEQRQWTEERSGLHSTT
jgi:hypothetical protein